MIENDIKSLNLKQTLTANCVNIIFLILEAYVVMAGVRITNGITDPILQSFTLIIIMFIALKYIRLRFSIIYNSKKGGLIRYD